MIIFFLHLWILGIRTVKPSNVSVLVSVVTPVNLTPSSCSLPPSSYSMGNRITHSNVGRSAHWRNENIYKVATCFIFAVNFLETVTEPILE